MELAILPYIVIYGGNYYMLKKIKNFVLLCMLVVALPCISCSSDRLLFNTQNVGCSTYCPSVGDFYSYEELYERSDYVYKIQIKSYKGYGESGYQCTRYDCWSFKILDTLKEEGKKVTKFYLQHNMIGSTYPELSKGQEYYVFLRDYTGYDKYTPNGLITFTEERNPSCITSVE